MFFKKTRRLTPPGKEANKNISRELSVGYIGYITPSRIVKILNQVGFPNQRRLKKGKFYNNF
jgi:hypothetical protein